MTATLHTPTYTPPHPTHIALRLLVDDQDSRKRATIEYGLSRFFRTCFRGGVGAFTSDTTFAQTELSSSSSETASDGSGSGKRTHEAAWCGTGRRQLRRLRTIANERRDTLCDAFCDSVEAEVLTRGSGSERGSGNGGDDGSEHGDDGVAEEGDGNNSGDSEVVFNGLGDKPHENVETVAAAREAVAAAILNGDNTLSPHTVNAVKTGLFFASSSRLVKPHERQQPPEHEEAVECARREYATRYTGGTARGLAVIDVSVAHMIEEGQIQQPTGSSEAAATSPMQDSDGDDTPKVNPGVAQLVAAQRTVPGLLTRLLSVVLGNIRGTATQVSAELEYLIRTVIHASCHLKFLVSGLDAQAESEADELSDYIKAKFPRKLFGFRLNDVIAAASVLAGHVAEGGVAPRLSTSCTATGSIVCDAAPVLSEGVRRAIRVLQDCVLE